MKILFLGDVVGRAGRDAVCALLPALKIQHQLDAVIINGENAAGGFGLTPEIFEDFVAAGADVVTLGDHLYDQDKLIPRLNQESRMVRAVNYPATTPGRGLTEVMVSGGRKLVVMQAMGQVFMKDHLDNPFTAVEKALESYRLGSNVHAVLVDMHAEATSEKCAMGHFLDGKVSVVIGSHTHIPTADARILPNGTAYQTDAGMCGDYQSVIGFEIAEPLQRLVHKRKARMKPAMGEGTLCGTIIETDDATGKALSIEILREGKSW